MRKFSFIRPVCPTKLDERSGKPRYSRDRRIILLITLSSLSFGSVFCGRWAPRYRPVGYKFKPTISTTKVEKKKPIESIRSVRERKGEEGKKKIPAEKISKIGTALKRWVRLKKTVFELGKKRIEIGKLNASLDDDYSKLYRLRTDLEVGRERLKGEVYNPALLRGEIKRKEKQIQKILPETVKKEKRIEELLLETGRLSLQKSQQSRLDSLELKKLRETSMELEKDMGKIESKIKALDEESLELKKRLRNQSLGEIEVRGSKEILEHNRKMIGEMESLFKQMDKEKKELDVQINKREEEVRKFIEEEDERIKEEEKAFNQEYRIQFQKHVELRDKLKEAGKTAAWVKNLTSEEAIEELKEASVYAKASPDTQDKIKSLQEKTGTLERIKAEERVKSLKSKIEKAEIEQKRIDDLSLDMIIKELVNIQGKKRKDQKENREVAFSDLEQERILREAINQKAKTGDFDKMLDELEKGLRLQADKEVTDWASKRTRAVLEMGTLEKRLQELKDKEKKEPSTQKEIDERVRIEKILKEKSEVEKKEREIYPELKGKGKMYPILTEERLEELKQALEKDSQQKKE